MIPVVIIPFALSLSKSAVVVRQTHHEWLDYPMFRCNQVLVMVIRYKFFITCEKQREYYVADTAGQPDGDEKEQEYQWKKG